MKQWFDYHIENETNETCKLQCHDEANCNIPNRNQQPYKHEMETELHILYYMILKLQHLFHGSAFTNLQQKDNRMIT